MKIVQVNAFHYPYRGGIEHRVHHIAKRLAEKHEVTILTGLLPKAEALFIGFIRTPIVKGAVVSLPQLHLRARGPSIITQPFLK